MATIQLTDEYNSMGGVGGTCALCNASKRTGVRPERIITTDNVTTMMDAEPGVWPEQWLEFCETCVVEMGHLLGMKTQDEIDDLTRTINQLIDQRDDLQEQLQANIRLVEACQAVIEQWGAKKQAPEPEVSTPRQDAVTPTGRKR